MSDGSQGAGWWQASDGKWYAPQQQPAPPPPPGNMKPRRRRGRGCLISLLAAFGLLVIIIIVVAVAASSSSKPGGGTTAHPASADVSISSCGSDPTLGIPQAKGTILNHSSGKSNYTFTVSFLNAAGTVVAQGGGIENDIAAGQSATFTVTGDSQAKGQITCKIVDVTRFAAP